MITEERPGNPVDHRFVVAGQWLVRLQADEVDPQLFASWLEWYEADPLNRAAFEEAQAVFESARGMSTEDRDRLGRSLVEQSKASYARSGKASLPLHRLRAWALDYRISFAAGALAVAVVAMAAWMMLAVDPSQVNASYQTSLATHRSETLPDGSVVHLGARSSISLAFSSGTRYVVLESGEALFKVAKDPTRPFVVQAGPVSVRAVGTEFNVRRAGDSTIVAVREGVVEVVHDRKTGPDAPAAKDLRLEVGQLVAVSAASQSPPVQLINVAAVSAWEAGRLEFFDESLPMVIATLNRYSSREIVVTDPALSALRVTASIEGRHIAEWVRALPDIFPVKVNEIGRATVLVSPAAGS